MLKWLMGYAAGAAAAVLVSVTSVMAAQPPVVPGYNRLKDEGKASPAQLGQVLLGELNCTQCHAAPQAKRILNKGAPDLSNIGARATAPFLRSYLAHPHDVKPGATMPDLFHASDPHSRDGAVDFLVQYLVSLGGPMKPAEEEGGGTLVEDGRRLYHTVGCVACHAPEKGEPAKVPSAPLPDLSRKTTVDQLEAFLLNPLAVRPGSRMPSLGLSDDEARAIAVYLLREQMHNPALAGAAPFKVHGVKYEYFEEHVRNAALRSFTRLKPKATGHLDHFSLDIPNRRGEEFALRLTATLFVPADGEYTFWTTSDDGSRLYIDARSIVNNDSDHSEAEKSGHATLKAGEHSITVTYFQRGGDAVLKVDWAGSDFKRQPIPHDALFRTAGTPMIPIDNEPFTLDPQKVEMGARMFSMIGCASCHAIPGQQPFRPHKPLADLNVDNDEGCLGTHVARQMPGYDLSDDQRQVLKAAIRDQENLGKPFSPSDQVIHTMAAMNCFACHNRDNIGGPPADRSDQFVMTSNFDMGDEGRIPPRLNFVGMKLLPQAMEQIIFEGKLHVRPVLATRMPTWGKQALGGIVESFQTADAIKEPPLPAFSEQAVKDGRQLVGVRGLGCVNCHGMNGQKSLGMPGPDLGTIHDRIKFGWFTRWLDNPAPLVPGTRMPQFWPGHEAAYKDIAGGTQDGQVAAIWTYFSLGRLMALPAGLIPTAGYELIPADAPIVHRTFMAGVGPRSILVGFPEMVHVAFDADGVRMAEAWRGKFFDAAGMWEGRGGTWNGPLGADVIDMPPGPSFAILDSPNAPWPQIVEPSAPPANEKYRNVGGRFKGYTLDKQERPTFHYVLKDVDIYEQPVPIQLATKSNLTRRFSLTSKGPVKDLYFMVAAGDKLEEKSPGVWSVDNGKLTILLKSTQKIQPLVRDENGQKQLVVPVQLTNGNTSFDVEMSW
ncbi:MAG TPA: c-type cytochrome [Tepidisphaeraceae bacterium]|nr:c-type cytochrome [Tepidisphaeraceae bacterium]